MFERMVMYSLSDSGGAISGIYFTPAQKAELDALAAMSDDDIDTSGDMPGIREYSHPRRGMFPGSSYMRVVPGVGSVRGATTDGRKGSDE